MAQERYIAVYPPALKLPAGGNPATHALEQGMAAWSQQLQQWLSQEVSKILGQATDHGQQIDALENVGKIKARAYRKAAQNIDAAGYTKVAIDTLDFDTESVVDITTNNRITPNLAGYYQVSGQIYVRDVPDGKEVFSGIYKNGAVVAWGSRSATGMLRHNISLVTNLIYCNGTTDYLELWAYNSYSSALALVVLESSQNYISVLGPF